ncbi:hypothetical protein VaNZ11_002281 [Volvox africanus]|uniref:Uncharacterized protein n=1 Tax=Volvox africanus TaxID=51714 RepID=A0ABQ5RRK3_9CHLO|nr:hypothetical protein VaNZ11_002281 [Volvox africanus]
MTATRMAPISRSPRTPITKTSQMGISKEPDGSPFGAGVDSQTEKPTPQGALSPSLFNSLQQRANKLRILLGSLHAPSGGRVVTGNHAESSPQPAAASGVSASAREAGYNTFFSDGQAGPAAQPPATVPAKGAVGTKPDLSPHQSGSIANGFAPTATANRSRPNSWSSGARTGDAGPSWQRGTQGSSQTKVQSKAKDVTSASVILREGAAEKSRSSGGGELTQASVCLRPPSQRLASVQALQHMQPSGQDAATVAAGAQRRDSSGGSPGALTLELRPPASVPAEPRVYPVPVGQKRHDEGVVCNPHVAIPMAVAGAMPTSTIYAAAAAAISTTATMAAAGTTAAANPQTVASTSHPALYRPHPPLAPPSQQPSWSSSLGEGPRRSSGGSGGGRRSSAGGSSYSDGGCQERPLHTPPLPPPAPLPAQAPQARLSRSPSPSPPTSCGGRDGLCRVGVHPVGVFLPQSSQAQHLQAAPQQQLTKLNQILPQDGSVSCALAPDGRPVAAAVTAMPPQPPPPPLPPPKDRIARGKTPGDASGLPQPLPLQVPAAAAVASVAAAPPRSQAAEELSAILSSLAAVTALPTAMPAATRQELPPPNLDRNHPDPSSVVPCELLHGMPPTEGGGHGACMNSSFGNGVAATTKSGAVCSDRAQKAHALPSAPEPQAGAVASGDGSAGRPSEASTSDPEAALVQALAVARASATAAFHRPEARVYRPRKDGFRTARSGSSSPPGMAAVTSAAPTAAGPGPGQIFAGVPAFAAPFSGRDGQAVSPRICGYHSSGVESARSNCGQRSASANSSRYERLLMLQEAGGNVGRHQGRISSGGSGAGGGGPPGPDFMRRNAVLLKKRQAWAAAAEEAEAKRRISRESEGSAGSPRNHQARPLRASWTATTDATGTVDACAASAGRGPASSTGAIHRSLVDLQRWADRREQRLAMLREEREAEERARAETQFTFKPEIGERSRRLAKLARARPSYVPLPGCSPPSRAQTTAVPAAAAAEAADPSGAASYAITRTEVGADAAGQASAAASTCPPRAQEGPLGRPPRASSAVRTRSSSANRGSVAGASSRATRGMSTSLSLGHADMLKEMRDIRPWQQQSGRAAVVKGPAQGQANAAGGGVKSKTSSAAAQLAAARNSRVRGRYATSSSTCYDDPVVGAVADAIKNATAALKLRPGPAQRATTALTTQFLSHQDPDLETRTTRPRARHKTTTYAPPQQPHQGWPSGRGARSSFGCLTGAGVGGRRRRASAIGTGAGTGCEEIHGAYAQHQQQQQQREQRRHSASLAQVDLWELASASVSPQTRSPDVHTQGGSRTLSLPPSPYPGIAIIRTSRPASPGSVGFRSNPPSPSPPIPTGTAAGGGLRLRPGGSAGLRAGLNMDSPAAAVLGSLGYGSPERKPESASTGSIARRTIDMFTSGSGGSGSGGLGVRTGWSPIYAGSTMAFGSDFSGSGMGDSLRFSLSTDSSSPFGERTAGSPVFLMLGSGAADGNATASPAAAVAATAAAAMVGPGGVLVRIPQTIQLSSPGPDGGQGRTGLRITPVGLAPPLAGDSAGGGATLIAAPTAPGGLAVGAFRYGSLTSSPATSYMALPYDGGNAVLRSSVRAGGVLQTTGFVATSTTLNDGLAQAVTAGRAISADTTDVAVNPSSATSTKFNSSGPTATPVTDIPLPSSTEATEAPPASAGAGGVAMAAVNSAFVSSSWPGVGTGARSRSPRGDRTALSSLRPEFASSCSVADTKTEPARRSSSGNGVPSALPPPQQEEVHITSASTAFTVADAMVANLSASADANAVANITSQHADSYSLARNSAPLPATSPGHTHGSLLRGVRFTKILAQQFAASLLLSNPASPSAVAAAAALGASVSASPAMAKTGGADAGPRATSSYEPASRDGILSAAGDGNEDAGGVTESLCPEPRSVSAPSGLASWLQTRVGGHVGISRAAAAAGMADYQGLCFEAVSLRTGRRPPSTSAGGAAVASTEPVSGGVVMGLVSTRSESGGTTLDATAGTTAVASVNALIGAGAHAACAAAPSSAVGGPDKRRGSDSALGGAHNAVMGILSRSTVSGSGVPSVPADTALASHRSANVATMAGTDPDHKAGQEDPLSALQSLIYKMKHLAGEGELTDCGSQSLRGTARTGSSGSGSRASDRECTGCATERCQVPVAVEGGAATMTANRISLSNGPRTAAPPHPGNSSAAGSAVTPGTEELPAGRDGGIGGSGGCTASAAVTANGSSDEASVPLAGPLPLEVLVQRAEQLRASIMGSKDMSRGCSPVSVSPAGSWTGSAMQHASPFSALGLCPGVAGAVNGVGGGPGGGVAAVIISPVQLRYGAAIANSSVHRSGLVSVSAGSGAASSSWRMGVNGLGVRSGSGYAGAEFVFPRLRSEAVPTAPTGARAIKLRPMGDSPGLAAVPQGQTMSEEEMMPEISLAGGLDQMPTGDRKSPRRSMTTALASEAAQFAPAATEQPRYSVWSLVDHLPSTVTSSTTSASAVTTDGSSTISTTAAGTGTVAAGTAPQPPLSVSQSSSSAAGLAASTGVSADAHVGYQALAPSASVRSSHSSCPEPPAQAVTSGTCLAKEGDGKQDGDSLAALQSLIRQVAHL